MATNDKRYIIFILFILHFEVDHQVQKTSIRNEKNINNKIGFVEISLGTNCWQELDLQTPFFDNSFIHTIS